MKYQFLNFFLEKKDLLKQNSEKIDLLLLENNKEKFEEIYNFYACEKPLLFVNGFMGTGKKQVVDYSLNFLSKEAIILWYNCFETTILDDILLVFFNEFKRLQTQGIISGLKIKTENFTAKINAYFTSIEKPFVIVLNSYDSIQKENLQEIVDFINHIIGFEKVKFVLISRTFDRKHFDDDTKVERIMISPLDKSLFEKTLKQNKVSFSSAQLDNLYKYTRGYYFYTMLTLSIMKYKKYEIKYFMDTFKQSFLSYNKFLEREIVDIIPAISVQFFWFLCLMRHGVTTQILKQLNYYDENNIEFLIQNNLIIQNNGLIFVHDYFREQMNISIPENVSQKLHKFIVDFYESQLPLKPLERGILLSRQTIRNEVEFHSLFLPKKISELNTNTYKVMASGLEFDLSRIKQGKELIQNQNSQIDVKEQSVYPSTSQNLREKPDYVTSSNYDSLNFDEEVEDLSFSFSEDEIMLMSNSSYSKNLSERMQSSINFDIKHEFEDLQSDENKENLEYYLNLAKEEESNYNFKLASEIYKKALTMTKDEEYINQLPVIYTKLGFAHHKLVEVEKALKYFDLAKEFYNQIGEFVKENYIKLNIANVYYESYKFDLAKSTLLEILSVKDNPNILNTKTYIALANIEDGLSNNEVAFDYYKKAMELSSTTMDSETLSELYFKYALCSDDRNDINTAIEFYEKCININNDSKVNKFLSSAYSNIATLYLEKNDHAVAVKNFLQAYKIDEENKNFDGIYFSATKLAQILQRKAPDKALKYFKKAKQCASKLNDIFYTASSMLALGDFYYAQKQDKLALDEYFTALDLVKNDFSKDNIAKIEMRINDIKLRVGADRFAVIENEYRIRKTRELEEEQQSKKV